MAKKDQMFRQDNAVSRFASGAASFWRGEGAMPAPWKQGVLDGFMFSDRAGVGFMSNIRPWPRSGNPFDPDWS